MSLVTTSKVYKLNNGKSVTKIINLGQSLVQSEL